MLKPVSKIRKGLAGIPGAMRDFPPNPGYEGSEEAVRSYLTRTISTLDAPDQESSLCDSWEDESDDSDSGADGDGGSFDPVFEVGAEVDERLPGLGGIDGEKIHQSFQLHGMDALAWYASFHRPGLQWGIYIPVSGMAYIIKHAFGELPVPFSTKAHLAFHAILNHELFHFATDYAIAQAELTHQEPWHIPAKTAFRVEDPNYCVEEEQLANAYMLAAFRSMKPALRVKGKQAALKRFVEMQPVGYRDALSVRPAHWDRLLENLARRYGSHTKMSVDHPSLWTSSREYDWAVHFPIRPRIDWRYCPIHFVDDSVRIGLPPGWLSCFSRLSAISESDEFRKKLNKLTPSIQQAWGRTKQKLGVTITAGADFKKWDKGGDDLYSVRVNDNFRAHLRRQRASEGWLAVAIGKHTEMGHG